MGKRKYFYMILLVDLQDSMRFIIVSHSDLNIFKWRKEKRENSSIPVIFFWPCFDIYMNRFVIFNQKLENEH